MRNNSEIHGYQKKVHAQKYKIPFLHRSRELWKQPCRRELRARRPNQICKIWTSPFKFSTWIKENFKDLLNALTFYHSVQHFSCTAGNTNFNPVLSKS